MLDSILNSIKKQIGIDPSDTNFDDDVIRIINSSFNELYQIGIEECKTFKIVDDSTKWSDMGLSDSIVSIVYDFVYSRCKLKFDPPQNSFTVTSIQEDLKEIAWRISIAERNN